MKNEINFVLGASKILSVNAIYKAKMTYLPGGRQAATIYKTKEAKMTEAYLKEQVELLDVPHNYPWVNKDTIFKMTVKVIFKSGYFLRDLDNTIKLLQDGIFRALGINDSHVVSIIADKVIFPDISEEKIFVCLSECSLDGVRFDMIPRPKIFWSPDLEFKSLKELPEKGIRKGKQYKTKDPEKADTFVYFITPENLTLDRPALIMTRLIECTLDSAGFVFIAIQDGVEYGDGFSEFESLIYEQMKEYSGIMLRRFKKEDMCETNLLEWINQ